MDSSHRRPYRSIFWPVALIGIGLVWLLGNFGLIPPANLSLLFALWPLLLVFVGLDLLLGRASPLLSALIGLLMIAVVVALLVAGPALGIRVPGAEFKVETFTVPAAGVNAVEYRIDSSSEPVEITPLSGSDALIDARIGHSGQVRFDPGSGAERVVTLEKIPGSLTFDFTPDFRDHKWSLALNPQVPTRLRLNSGSGSVAMDLSGMNLTNLDVDSGSGSVAAVLPSADQEYNVVIDSGSGSVAIRLPADTTLTLRLRTGSGAATVDIPPDAAVWLEVEDGGSGSVNIPARLQRLKGERNEDEGEWQTQGFNAAASQVHIIVEEMGYGSINID